MNNSLKILKTAGFMAMATLLAKCCGMVRDMLIAAYFGTGYMGEAYMTATKLPTTLFDIVIGGVISSSFIPIFNGIIKKESKEEAMKFANRFIGMIMLITVLITAFGIICSDWLIGLMAPSLSAETQQLASLLSSIMFPMIIFTGLAFSFVGILQSFGEFNIPAVMSLVSNLAVIIYFPVFGKRFGVYGLSVTMVIAWSLQAIIQIPSLKKFGYKFRPTLNFKDKGIRDAMKLAGPLLISTWVQPLYSIVNTRLASGVSGGITMLEYANRLYLVIVGVFSFVVTNLIFPKLSRSNAEGDPNGVRDILATSMKSLLIVILPIMCMIIILAVPIVSVIYERGQFTSADAYSTGIALSCYSVGMVGFAVNEILAKTFFSMKNSKTPMITAIASMAANIAAAYTLSGRLGINGLALATAAGSTVNAVLNFIFIRRKMGKIFTSGDVKSIVKTVFAAAASAAAVWGLSAALSGVLGYSTAGKLLKCVICGIGGMAVYAAVCIISGVDEIKMLLKRGDGNA